MSDVVAAFDVDGTLTTTDTFVPFVRAVAGPWRSAAVAVEVAPLALAVAAGRASRDDLKARVVHGTLGGRAVATLRAVGEQHARRIERGWLRGDTTARLRWHQREGHRTVLVSASLRYYLEPLARSLGIDQVLCTDLAVDGTGDRVTGELAGGNCRGQVKADRLLALLGGPPAELWAYGDSAGDDQLLALAQHPVRVGPKTYVAGVPLPGVDR